MKTSTVNISFKEELLKDIDDVAKKESRSRSELIREAARLYIDQKKKWETIFQFGTEHTRSNELNEADIEREIKAYRKTKRTL